MMRPDTLSVGVNVNVLTDVSASNATSARLNDRSALRDVEMMSPSRSRTLAVIDTSSPSGSVTVTSNTTATSTSATTSAGAATTGGAFDDVTRTIVDLDTGSLTSSATLISTLNFASTPVMFSTLKVVVPVFGSTTTTGSVSPPPAFPSRSTLTSPQLNVSSSGSVAEGVMNRSAPSTTVVPVSGLISGGSLRSSSATTSTCTDATSSAPSAETETVAMPGLTNVIVSVVPTRNVSTTSMSDVAAARTTGESTSTNSGVAPPRFTVRGRSPSVARTSPIDLSALSVGGSSNASISSVTVAGSLTASPSLTVNENSSVPEKSARGVYVTV